MVGREEMDLLDGVTASMVETPRLKTHLLSAGPGDGGPVFFLHGNVSSSRFFEEALTALLDRYRGLASVLRGFGGTEAKPVDATRGLRDFSDDLHSLIEVLRELPLGGSPGLRPHPAHREAREVPGAVV